MLPFATDPVRRFISMPIALPFGFPENVAYKEIPDVQIPPDSVKPLYKALSDTPTPSYLEQATTKLSDLWANTELLITPESTGEALVNQIYGYDANGKQLVPPNQTLTYDPETISTPNVVTKAKTVIKDTVSAVTDSMQGAFVKYGIIAVIVLFALVLLYGVAGGYGRRLAL